MNRKIILAGGTGFLGSKLSSYLSQKGYEVIVLTRVEKLNDASCSYVKWDGKTINYWAEQLNGGYALINLSGRSVDCRYTRKNKKEIYDSRLESTYILGQALKCCKNPPKVWINASSATIYRHSNGQKMDEINGEIGTGFSVDVCKKWENIFFSADTPGIRKVAIRTAIVLDKDHGALKQLSNLVRTGLGGKQGTGNQFFSWIHIEDFCRAIIYLINNPDITGVVNVAAPYPVKNKYFMQVLKEIKDVSFGINLPEWLLKAGAVLIRTETELILKSRNVIPAKLERKGFDFIYPDIRSALKDLSYN